MKACAQLQLLSHPASTLYKHIPPRLFARQEERQRGLMPLKQN
jgi:hypothetical protein